MGLAEQIIDGTRVLLHLCLFVLARMSRKYATKWNFLSDNIFFICRMVLAANLSAANLIISCIHARINHRAVLVVNKRNVTSKFKKHTLFYDNS